MTESGHRDRRALVRHFSRLRGFRCPVRQRTRFKATLGSLTGFSTMLYRPEKLRDRESTQIRDVEPGRWMLTMLSNAAASRSMFSRINMASLLASGLSTSFMPAIVVRTHGSVWATLPAHARSSMRTRTGGSSDSATCIGVLLSEAVLISNACGSHEHRGHHEEDQQQERQCPPWASVLDAHTGHAVWGDSALPLPPPLRLGCLQQSSENTFSASGVTSVGGGLVPPKRANPSSGFVGR